MSFSMYQVSVPLFIRNLTNLDALLDKAAADAEARKIEMPVLLGARLAPDMFPLSRQIIISCSFATGASARLAGLEVPVYDDKETTLPELKGRIAKAIAFLKTLSEGQIAGSEDRDITIPIDGKPTTLKGVAYLLNRALPNFYFHCATAYDILRHNGVPLGKRDFIGPM